MKLIVANWKMNPEKLSAARVLFSSIKRASRNFRKSKIVICPPSVFISAFSNSNSSKVSIGAQDCFWENTGSHTGEISPQMLRYLGVKYVILGHSERRATWEDNNAVAKKVKATLEAGLYVILCIGERTRDTGGEYFDFIERQIHESLFKINRKFLKRLVIAYEPIWAIGKSSTDAAKPEDLHEMGIFIKKTLIKVIGKKDALDVPILYGGSVEPDNAAELMNGTGIDGFLVGHASLSPGSFKEILEVVERIK